MFDCPNCGKEFTSEFSLLNHRIQAHYEELQPKAPYEMGVRIHEAIGRALTSPEVKFFEVRDRGTCIVLMCTKFSATPSDRERKLLERAGFSGEAAHQAEYVIAVDVTGGAKICSSDPFEWRTQTRTHPIAHDWILRKWDSLTSDSVIDVECILGETSERKTTEIP
jgi:hypothetical protein